MQDCLGMGSRIVLWMVLSHKWPLLGLTSSLFLLTGPRLSVVRFLEVAQHKSLRPFVAGAGAGARSGRPLFWGRTELRIELSLETSGAGAGTGTMDLLVLPATATGESSFGRIKHLHFEGHL